jgi:hypothetical protein
MYITIIIYDRVYLYLSIINIIIMSTLNAIS